MARHRTIALLALWALFAVGACDEAPGGDRDMNGPAGGKADAPGTQTGDAVRLSPLDTSFLIPRSQIKLTEAQLPMSAFSIVHESTEFRQGTSTDLRGTAEEIYDTLFVTGVRYDPCAPTAFHGSTPSSTCHEEFRLVVQPQSPPGRFADAAMHLVFDVEDGRALRDALRTIRVDCNDGSTSDAGRTDGPVGIHPCADELEGLFEALIDDFAQSAHLKGVATMVTVAVPGIEWHWQLLANGPSGLRLLPSLPGLGGDMGAFRSDGSYVTEPSTALALPGGGQARTTRLQSITAARSAEALDLGDAAVQEGLMAAYAADNPRLSEISRTDCMACHVQSPALTVLEDSGLLDRLDGSLREQIQAVAYKDLDRIAGEHWSEARNSQKSLLVDGNYLVINFGFLFDRPSVNRRVQHEAEDAALFIEQRLRDGDRPDADAPPTDEPPTHDVGIPVGVVCPISVDDRFANVRDADRSIVGTVHDGGFVRIVDADGEWAQIAGMFSTQQGPLVAGELEEPMFIHHTQFRFDGCAVPPQAGLGEMCTLIPDEPVNVRIKPNDDVVTTLTCPSAAPSGDCSQLVIGWDDDWAAVQGVMAVGGSSEMRSINIGKPAFIHRSQFDRCEPWPRG